jgi:hypothetical protein
MVGNVHLPPQGGPSGPGGSGSPPTVKSTQKEVDDAWTNYQKTGDQNALIAALTNAVGNSQRNYGDLGNAIPNPNASQTADMEYIQNVLLELGQSPKNPNASRWMTLVDNTFNALSGSNKRLY